MTPELSRANTARSAFVGLMFARLPFFIAGTLKIAYDLLLYRQFVAIQPLEEKSR
jgi:hypothetical protein